MAHDEKRKIIQMEASPYELNKNVYSVMPLSELFVEQVVHQGGAYFADLTIDEVKTTGETLHGTSKIYEVATDPDPMMPAIIVQAAHLWLQFNTPPIIQQIFNDINFADITDGMPVAAEPIMDEVASEQKRNGAIATFGKHIVVTEGDFLSRTTIAAEQSTFKAAADDKIGLLLDIAEASYVAYAHAYGQPRTPNQRLLFRSVILGTLMQRDDFADTGYQVKGADLLGINNIDALKEKYSLEINVA